MEELFSYGTLQQENVQIETFNRKLGGEKDTLIGYQLSEVEIKDKNVIKASGTNIHPILKFTGNDDDKVEGTVFEVTTTELAYADEYEAEEYKRTSTKLSSGKVVWVYSA